MRIDLQKEMKVAVEAVRAAAAVCQAVQANLVTTETLAKKDKSPVTVADFAAQAVVCATLGKAFADDPVVGEEGAAELKSPENAGLLAAVAKHAQMSEAEAIAAIERGGFDPLKAPGVNFRGRYWTLDPIDGTKGFLRGEQYAVALGLIIDGEVVLGVLGCPNLPTVAGGSETGVMMTAVRGGGARMLKLGDPSDAGVSVKCSSVGETSGARFCESVESGHTDQDASVQIAAKLGITNEPFRIDSQCKYAAVARGDAEVYLRLPTKPGYEEKIWDHAAGMIVMQEAGGTVTDIFGKPLDFSRGRTLSANKGVIATCGAIHGAVVEAVGECFVVPTA